MSDGLINFEAEEKVLGFLFNPLIPEDKKTSILEVLYKEHFANDKYRIIFGLIKLYRIYDKIILWDKVSHVKLQLEAEDLNGLEEFVTYEDAQSYMEILLDKYQKRGLYNFGNEIKEAMLRGESQFEMALKAQQILTHIASDTKLETNQDLLEKVLNEKPGDTLSTGYRALDKSFGGYSRGMVVTIAGDSGHLKTTFALDSAFKIAEKNPRAKIAIFSKEMLATDLLKKQIARICNIPVGDIFGQNYDKDAVREKMKGIEAWESNRIRIINPSTFKGVADIAKIQMTHKFDVWFLDFIQLLEFSKQADTSSDFNIQVGQNMRNLQSLALGTKSVGIILSQVKKGIEHRTKKRPTVSDIEWSGLIKQLSSYIFFSYYPNKYYGSELMPDDYYYLIGEKTRFAENFIFPMRIEASFGKFHEVSAAEKSKMIKRFNTIVG